MDGALGPVPPTPPAASLARGGRQCRSLPLRPARVHGVVNVRESLRASCLVWSGGRHQLRVEPLHVGGGLGLAADGLQTRDGLLYDLHARSGPAIRRQKDSHDLAVAEEDAVHITFASEPDFPQALVLAADFAIISASPHPRA